MAVSGCSNEFGLQAQIFSSDDCSNFIPVSNCFSPAYVTSGSLVAAGLTVGQTYYLMVDGWSVAVCDYSLLVLNGTTGVGISAEAGTDAYLCASENLLLDGSGSTIGSNYSYSWTTTDGNIVSGASSLNPTVNSPGTYELTVTHNIFGCSATDIVTVNQGDAFITSATVSGTLDCSNTMVNLDGSGSSTGVAISYNWFTSDGSITGMTDTAVTTADSPGSYLLTVTNTNTGCQDTAWVTVTSDVQAPEVSASGGTIDCNNTTVELTSNSATDGVTYAWTGPNNYSSAEQNPTVSQSGVYTVSVTAPNGCSASATVSVSGNNTPPDISASGGTLNCSETAVMLNAVSTVSVADYMWSSPNGFNSDVQNPVVTQIGDYTVTVTAANGCTASATVSVNADNDTPDLTAAGGMLSCTSANVQLTAGSAVAGVSYAWTSPNSFSSELQNPVVSEAGVYTVTVTAPNGCTETITVNVTQDDAAPDAQASGGLLNCSDTAVQLTGNSTSPNVTYAWTSPNGFASAAQNPTVSEPGDYSLIVTGENGCTATATTTVTSDTTIPDVTAVGGVIDCSGNTVQLSGNSATIGVSYAWTGPDNFTSDEQNPAVEVTGNYFLTVTAANGCTNNTSANVTADADIPVASATGGTIGCNNTSVQLTGSSDDDTAAYNWTGPNEYNVAEQNPTVSESGTYILTVTSANGCSAEATATVFLDNQIPDITAAGGILDCTGNAVQLTGNSSTAGVIYNWTGPNDYTSDEQNPAVVQSGDYTLKVTATNGCFAELTVTVATDAGQPEALVTGGTQTCNDENVQLSGNSSTADVTYSWTGPDLFSSAEQNPTVNLPGEYILTVTASNGCSANAYAIVFPPQIPEATATGGTINCTGSSVQLTANSSVSEVIYSWTGPNDFISTEQNPVIEIAGVYNLMITADNGCIDTASIEVTANLAEPSATAEGGTIDCNNNSVQLTGNSDDDAANYSWTGPNSFSSTEQNPTVSESGEYTLIITSANGCSTEATATVFIDNQIPDVSATGGTINCTETNIQLAGNSMATDVMYSWTGPNDFVSDAQNPVVSQGGIYTLTVTTPGGCTNSAVAAVNQSTDVPTASTTGGEINCIETSVQLSGSSDAGGVSYSWAGPGTFTSAAQNPVVTEAGTYILTVESANGCTSSATAEVILNTTTPDAAAGGGMLSCSESSVQLTGNSTTDNVDYIWTGPNNFFSDLQNPIAATTGIYTLKVTAANGCTETASAEVTADAGLPDASAIGGQQSCDNLTVPLTGNTDTPGASYLWTGPDGFSSADLNESVSTPGNYIFTVTAPNGCTAAATATVLAAQKPEVSATGGTLDCNQTEILVNTSADINGLSYSWTGPNDFTSDLSSPTLTAAGLYTVIADAGNNCTDTFFLDIPIDTLSPAIIATGGILSCGVPQIQLTATSPEVIDAYLWTSPTGVILSETSPLVTEAGLYDLQVYSSNGCSGQTTALVEADTLTPQISLFPVFLSCNQTSGTANPVVSPTGGNYTWTGPNDFDSSLLNPVLDTAGEYVLTVISNNGCSSSAAVTVTDGGTIPEVAVSGGDISCEEQEVTLSAESSETDLTFMWTGPNNFISDQANPTVSAAGDYTLTATDSGGCIFTTTISVSGTGETVELNLTGDVLSCNNPSVVIQSNSPNEDLIYEWTGPDIFSSEEANPTVSAGGEYFVTATAPGGCSTTETIIIQTDTLAPSVSVTGGFLNCITTSVQLSAGSTTPGVGYAWIGPNNFMSTVQNPIVTEGGAYTLSITADNGCSSEMTAEVITDNTVPNVNAGFDFELNCQMTEAILSGSVDTGGDSFSVQWYTLNGSITDSPQVLSPLIDRGGTYVLEAINSVNGCTAVDTVTITESPDILRYLVPTPVSPSCFGESDGQILLDSITGGTSPIFFSINDMAFSEATTITDLTAGTYYVTAADAAGCMLEVVIELESPDYWEVELGANITINPGDSTALNADISVVSAPVANIQWSPAEGLSCIDCSTPTATPSRTTTYSIIVTNTEGCTVTDEITVTVDGEVQHVYIPNAFSPDGDTYNDVFIIYADDTVTEILSLDIYDRWGNEIFRTQGFSPGDETAGWDGTRAGEPTDTGVYIYQCVLQYANGQTELLKGDVSLFR